MKTDNRIGVLPQDIPANWEIVKFRRVAVRMRKRRAKGDLLSVYLNEGVIPFAQGGEDRVHNPSEDLGMYQVVNPGQLVMNNQQAWRGSVGVSVLHGIISPAYHIYELSPKLDANFASYLFRSRPMVLQYDLASRGVGTIQKNLDESTLKDIIVPVPPLGEQRRIADFLDGQVARFNSLANLMQNELARLDELDRGYVFDCLISQASFDPKLGFQIVGADKDWPVVPLFHLCDEVKNKNLGSVETNLLSLSYGNIIDKDIETAEGLLPESFENYNKVKPGDIVLRLTDLQNDQKSLRVGRVSKQGIITSAYTTLRPKRVDPGFLSYQMKAFDSAKFFYALGGGLRQSMKFDDLKNLLVLLPDEIEQVRLVQQIDAAFSASDSLRRKLKLQIQLVSELRVATVTAAVTGTFDVTTGRNVA